MAYPSVVTSFTNPNPTDRLNSPSHSSIESAQNTGLTEIQTFVGTLSSVEGTLMYDVRAAASGGGGHVQSANKGGTGQTSYAKGDILVAQSSSVLSKVVIGSDTQFLMADSTQQTGVRWYSVGRPTVNIYSTPSTLTWVKPSTLAYIIVECVGGGGSGGGADASNAFGSGGGGGGYARKMIVAASLLSTETVIVGAKGASILGTGGNAGGRSSFGTTSILSASGGNGGSSNNTGIAGANGGIGSGGDLNIGGQGGGATNTGMVGAGGSSHYGGGGAGRVSGTAPGRPYGGGGAGTTSGGTASGGEGADGLVIVTEYPT